MNTPIQTWQALVATGKLEPDPAQQRAVQKLTALQTALRGWQLPRRRRLPGRAPVSPPGLYLHGPVGRGKSMLMDMFFEAVPLARKRRVHFHQFMLDIHAALGHWRSLEKSARRRHPGYQRGGGDDPVIPVANALADEAWLLCLDEMHITDIADAMVLGRLFEQLIKRGVVLVTTSNRHPDDLYKDGLGRERFLPFIAMLKGRLDVLALEAARDYRLDRMGTEKIWLAPLNAQSRTGIQMLWDELCTGLHVHPRQISLAGRHWLIARTAGGTARLGFAETCEQARGAADYLELARQFHTLVLEDIPLLDIQRRSASWRFTALIDALYEARVKLLASAAAEPQSLFCGTSGGFEFQRTVSRLMEMQSAGYLAAGHGASGLIV